jgi:23S rRNA G2069 N7-methylase RlmK/C1962 C5-methylase RlmI
MYCKSENFTLYHGDNRQILPTFAENSVDAIVTDPPYELGFMGKSWDASGVAFDPATWREALRVLKPGGHLIAFSGSRTYHRMAVAIEDAGFEIRDQIMWIYGSGFPKSHNIEKAIDKIDGVEMFIEKGEAASGVGFMNAEGAGGYNTTNNQLEHELQKQPSEASNGKVGERR